MYTAVFKSWEFRAISVDRRPRAFVGQCGVLVLIPMQQSTAEGTDSIEDWSSPDSLALKKPVRKIERVGGSEVSDAIASPGDSLLQEERIVQGQ